VKVATAKQEEAQGAIKLTQIGIDLCTIKVPFVSRSLATGSRPSARDVGKVLPDSGRSTEPRRKYTILDRKIALNQMVGPPNTTHLFTLVGSLEQVDLHVQINESDIGKVRAGEKVYFTVTAYQDEDLVFTGEVVETRLLPTVIQGSVYYTAVITAKNQKDEHGNWRLRPGMTTAAVDIIARTAKDAWIIPNTALDIQLDEAYYPPGAKETLAHPPKGEGWVPVWVLQGDTPKPVWVKPGLAGKINDDKKGGLRGEPYTAVEWDPEFTPQPTPGVPETYPKLIIGAPPVKKSKLFNFGSVIKF